MICKKNLHRYFLCSLLFFLLVNSSGCRNRDGGSPALVSISVTPGSVSVFQGAVQQFTATGTYSDNSTQDLTSSTTWTSSNASVAIIAGGGIATSITAGTTSITTARDGLSGSSTLIVTTINSVDADGFFWGTEGDINIDDAGKLTTEASAIKNAINGTLRTNIVKLRLSMASFSTQDGGLTWSVTYCLPSPEQCMDSFNMDEVAKLYQTNGWSMVPMFRHDETQTITTDLIDKYVNFVDWFLGAYKSIASVQMIELVNYPIPGGDTWKGTESQVVELTNKTYDRIKSKYPDISVGTPGFEYWMDNNTGDDASSISLIEYFLDKNNGAKFDFWAFHGYAMTGKVGGAVVGLYPPTTTPLLNAYANVTGILNIRAAMDTNGWQDRKIIDTEHCNAATLPAQSFTNDSDALDAAYLVQELTLKRTLMNGTSRVLTGILPLKIAPRGTMGEATLSSLNADGSVTLHAKAMGLLLNKLKSYNYSGRLSGAFDDETQAWVEKFTSAAGELYIFFKPFKYMSGQPVYLDGETLNYTLNLSTMPSSVVLTAVDGSTTTVNPAQSLTLTAENTPGFLEVTYP